MTAVAHRCCQRARGVHRPVLSLATAALGSFELSSNLFSLLRRCTPRSMSVTWAEPLGASSLARPVAPTTVVRTALTRSGLCSLDGREPCDSQRGSVLDTGAEHRSTFPFESSSPPSQRTSRCAPITSPFRTAPSISAREESARDAASRFERRAISRRASRPETTGRVELVVGVVGSSASTSLRCRSVVAAPPASHTTIARRGHAGRCASPRLSPTSAPRRGPPRGALRTQRVVSEVVGSSQFLMTIFRFPQ